MFRFIHILHTDAQLEGFFTMDHIHDANGDLLVKIVSFKNTFDTLKKVIASSAVFILSN